MYIRTPPFDTVFLLLLLSVLDEFGLRLLILPVCARMPLPNTIYWLID